MQDKLVDSLYTSRQDLEKQIKVFAKRYAAVGFFKN